MPRLLPLAALITALVLPAYAAAYCDEPADPRNPSRGLPDGAAIGLSDLFDGPAQGNAMEQLGSLAREAIAGSAEVRAAQHNRRAAQFDLQQAEAGRKPIVAVGGNAGAGQTRVGGVTKGVGGVGGASIGVSAPLYDGGRVDQFSEYRRRLVDVGAAGATASREQVVEEALATALERNRHRMTVRVYQQYAAKMSCLVQSLERIVAQDRGRASELVQARQSQRQAEIARDEAISSLRQADTRLRKLVGNNVEPWGAVGVPLLQVPELGTVVDEIAQSPVLRQLKLQADALESLARATQAEARPQVNWQVGANAGRSAQVTTGAWTAGLTLNYTLDDGGAIAAATNAAVERAAAARRQQEATMNDRVRQATVYHEAARSAFVRARSYAEVLRDSDQVRNATFEQWSRLGRRSLFDLMSAEASHYQLRVAYVNALHDGFAATSQLRAVGAGLLPWIAPELTAPPR